MQPSSSKLSPSLHMFYITPLLASTIRSLLNCARKHDSSSNSQPSAEVVAAVYTATGDTTHCCARTIQSPHAGCYNASPRYCCYYGADVMGVCALAYTAYTTRVSWLHSEKLSRRKPGISRYQGMRIHAVTSAVVPLRPQQAYQ
eukprot:9490373-Pyramimonas_sp.AAC.3